MGKCAINKRSIGRMGITVVLMGLLIILVSPRFSWAQDSPVRIGVLAKRGIMRCIEKWSPTADYLTDKISGKTFVIVPVDSEGIFSFVQNGAIDFVLANPTIYVELESLYGANRIATLKNFRLDGAHTKYGGVVLVPSWQDIEKLQQKKGLKAFLLAGFILISANLRLGISITY